MPSLTAADMASRTMRKGWVQEADDDATQNAAEAAAERTRRSVKSSNKEPLETMSAPMKRRKSVLYDKDEED